MSRILFVSSEFPPGPGGIGKHAFDLCSALARKGFVIDIFSSVDYASDEEIKEFVETLPKTLNLFRFKRTGIGTYFSRFRMVFKALKTQSYDRQFFSGKFSLWLAAILKVSIRSNQHKIEFFVHGSEINPSNFFSRKLTHWALSKADQIYAVSNFTRSRLPCNLINIETVRVVPNGINPTDWPDESMVTPFSDWKGHPKLLTVGSITPRKGQHRVIKALPKLIQHYPDIHYHIVGIDTYSAYLRDLVVRMGLTNHVTLHGRLIDKDDLARAYKTADLFILLSENQPDGDIEGFGIVVLEANLYGLPVIGALDCGIEEAVKPGVNGELVNADDIKIVSDQVVKVLDERGKYKKKMETWLRIHDWNVICESLTQ